MYYTPTYVVLISLKVKSSQTIRGLRIGKKEDVNPLQFKTSSQIKRQNAYYPHAGSQVWRQLSQHTTVKPKNELEKQPGQPVVRLQ